MTTTITRAALMGGVASAAILGLGQVARADDPTPAETTKPANVETIVVTGTRPQATEIKRNAPVVMDIAPLAQIRSLPDVNAAEALQRLPGIQMESDSGEGRFVNIRGMDADLNGTTFDGVRMMASNPASPQGGARAVAFDAFPAGILGGLEVIKSMTPDLDAEGLGGIVNIQPRIIPPGEDHIFDASVSGGIQALRGNPVYQGDLTIGKRFFDDKLSVIFTYGVADDHRGIDDIEEDYAFANDGIDVPPGTSAFLGRKQFDNLQYRWYEYHRTRQGWGGGATFDPTPNTELYLRGFHAGYTEIAHKHEFVLSNLGHDIASVSPGGSYDATQAAARYSDINTKEELGNDLVEFGGHTLIADRFKLDGRVSWTEGFAQFPYAINAKFLDPNAVDLVYNNADPKRPTYKALGGVNLADPALYTQFNGGGGNSPSHNTDTEYAGALNLSFPLEFAGDQGEFKLGVEVRERERMAQQFTADLTPTSSNLAGFVSGPDIFFYNNEYNLGPQPIFDKLLAIPQTPVTADPSTFEHDNENIVAGYAQYSASFGNLDVIGGVRVEATDGTYRANTITTDAAGDTTITPNSVSHSYTNFFPDIAFKYHATDHLQFRLAFSTAIARPGFNQITAARSIDLQNAIPIVTQGNPNLKPTTGNSVDLYAEYFLPHDGILSAGVFYKGFQDYITSQQLNSTTVPGFVGQTVDLQTFQNIGRAHVEGVELQYNQLFDFLPGLLSGLGVESNLTYVNSRGLIRPGEFSELPQTSPLAYNAALSYDKGPVSLKLAASYVSTNLWVVGGSPSTDVYSQPRFRLDLGSEYRVNDHVEFFFQAKNLTNTHLEFTYTKSRAFPIQNEFYDSDFLFGIRVRQ
ncbi:MAG TPA: TonB-dependent receptor [Caulobacteraceae bacterium]|nr:TonB-dependent receptor [Caulobacteraceae bacterium]